jgi:uncharacterized protein (DUF2252 family)
LQALGQYRQSLPSNWRSVIDKYTPECVGFKVVGLGSIGTRDYVVSLFGNGKDDPLFLQIKEECASAWRGYPGSQKGPRHEGRRVAEGQWAMQTVSDPLLGWTEIDERPYLVRQLADYKAFLDESELRGRTLYDYARECGQMFAMAHGQTGDAVSLVGYCCDGKTLDKSLAKFAVSYADQVTSDHQTFTRDFRAGRIRV